jgi:hypothetical protein
MKLKRFYKDIKKRGMFSLFEIVHNLFLVLNRWLFLKKNLYLLIYYYKKPIIFLKKMRLSAVLRTFA